MTLAEADAEMRRLNGSPADAEETLNVQAALPLNLVVSGVCTSGPHVLRAIPSTPRQWLGCCILAVPEEPVCLCGNVLIRGFVDTVVNLLPTIPYQ